METGLRIPIFPLNAVLFPYAVLPLHIFEPRYLKMVDHCLETGEGFGVALLREGTEIDPRPRRILSARWLELPISSAWTMDGSI